MGNQYSKLEQKHQAFISRQKIFFTATAAAESKVNVSPRSTDAFRVLDEASTLYLDRTGSGNETAAHLKADGRMTIMFCAFEGPPQIMRLYGRGRILHRSSKEFAKLLEQHFDGNAPLGARQMVRLDIEMLQTSCGFGVPLFDYKDERSALDRWTEKKGPQGIEDYWREENVESLDGLQTGLIEQ